jgi:hypothetical protein
MIRRAVIAAAASAAAVASVWALDAAPQAQAAQVRIAALAEAPVVAHALKPAGKAVKTARKGGFLDN